MSTFPRNLCSNSHFVSRVDPLAPNPNSKEPLRPIPNFTLCLGIGFVLAIFLASFAFDRTDFSPRRIQVPLLSTVDPPSSFSFPWPQKFRFLGRGHQVYAFVSEDERFVLKFFDRRQLKLHWYAYFPFKISKKKKRRFKERIEMYPQSYYLAFEWFRNETGLFIVHQGISREQYPTVQVTDARSKTFTIDLNRVPFILQKKAAHSLPELLVQAKTRGDLSSIIDQFLTIHRQRLSLLIGDRDRNIYDNYGWDGKRLIYIDPGRFYREKNLSDPRVLKAEWLRVTGPIRKWLVKHAPQELLSFDEKIKRFLDWQKKVSYNEGCIVEAFPS